MSINSNAILATQNINFSYDKGTKYLLKDINLTLETHEIVSIMGDNGSGKSTLMRIIAGIIAYKGTILFENEPITDLHSYKRDIAYLPDKPMLYDSLSARDNLRLICNLWLVDSEKNYMSRAMELLKELNLLDDLDKKVEDYSLGMKDKLFFVACIARRPKLILLDEPFSSWDKNSVIKAIQILKEYVTVNNSAVLFITHSEYLRETLSDIVYELKDGNLTQV